MANFDSARIICASGQDIGLFKVVYSPAEVELDQIQLLPAWQKKGIGTKLITMLQHECAAVNLPITLHVLRLNPALALYQRLGFKVTQSGTHSHTMYWRFEQNNALGEPQC
jgi:GNAT superfamily N-acetyltransferase